MKFDVENKIISEYNSFSEEGIMFEYAGFEISELVAEYSVYHPQGPRDMVVRIYKYPSGKFEARCNYSYWGPDQIGPYHRSVPDANSKEEAVKSALQRMMMNHQEDYADYQFAWVRVDDPQETVVLGSGEVVSKEEFLRMRKGSEDK
jgi:hypothetical protein